MEIDCLYEQIYFPFPFPMVVNENDVIQICWRCTVNLFLLGARAGITATNGGKGLGTINYFSNFPHATLLEKIRFAGNKFFNGSPFCIWLTESQLFTPAAQTELNLFLAPKNESYSNMSFPK